MSVVINSLLVLLLTSSALMAQGGIFGIHLPVCVDGGINDVKTHQCLYCAKGTEPSNQDLLKERKCKGVPILGNHCPLGNKAWYDSKNKLCIYCEAGYTFFHHNKKCHK